MKDYYGKLCLAILEEHFGSIIQCIGNSLLHGTKSLVGICLDTRLPRTEVHSKLIIFLLTFYIFILFFKITFTDIFFFSRVDRERTDCPYKIWICHL